MNNSTSPQYITRSDVAKVLLRVETSLGADDANLLRAYLAQLESQIRIYALDDDKDQEYTT